jgi:hypothetical protein
VVGGYPVGESGGCGGAGEGTVADGCGVAAKTWRQAKQQTDTDGCSAGTWLRVPQLGQRAWNMVEETHAKALQEWRTRAT